MWRRIWRGYRATVPLAVSILPFGIAYGTIAAGSMAPWQVQLMSLTLFTGTAQFITASLLAQGAAYLPIFVTGLLVNSRMVLMSAALTPHLRRAPRALQPLAAQLLTDESFAVSLAEFEQNHPDVLYLIGSGLGIYTFWQAATFAGAAFGSAIPDGLGLDFALPASLICLLFLLVRNKRAALVAVLAAALSLALLPLVSPTWSTMVATLVAATLGVLGKRWLSRS